MLKKLLAGLTAVVLSLGMVALTAAPASAHHNTVNANVSCNTGTEGTWKVTWTIQNSENRPETITSSSDESIVPVGTAIAGNATLTVVTYYTTKPASNVTLTLSAKWDNNVTHTASGTLSKNDFKDHCLPDDTDKKVDVCHYDNGQGGKYTRGDVSVNSVLNGTGHGGHANDIIPPFDYVKQGVAGHYDGKNWSTHGQWLYANNCSNVVTPAVPTFTSAVCTGPGTNGPASYTIPATTGVKYEVRFANGGGWTETGAGTYTLAADGYVQVRAVALSGYSLTGTDSWKKQFSALDCDVTVTATQPTKTEAVCTGEEQVGPASFTIPDIAGVQYQRLVGWTWNDVAPGSHPAVDGSLVTLRAVPLAGYELSGQKFFLLLFDNLNASKDCIVPAAPTFDPQECTAPGDPSPATFTIPSDVGVRYQQWNGTTWVTIAAGTYDVDAFPATVSIRAVTKSGYHFLAGATTEWSEDFVSAGDCVLDVQVPPATVVAQECIVQDTTLRGGKFGATIASLTGIYVDGWITIPSTPNVDYFIDGILAAAGDHTRPPGTYTVSAVAHSGYTLSGYTGPWVLEIVAAPPCGDLDTHPSVTPVVTFVQASCLAAGGSYTLAVDEPGLEDGVVWTVSGGLPTTLGTHSVSTGGTVTVTATPASGYGLNGPLPPQVWTYTFTALPDDCLPTLAFTGGGIALGALGLSAVLTLGGILLFTARRRDDVVGLQG